MREDIKQSVIDNLKKHEGCVDHMYLDTRGTVTCAVGHALFSWTDAIFEGIDWYLLFNNQIAKTDLIVNEWLAVKGLHEPGYKLILKPDDCDLILARDLVKFDHLLFSEFPRLDTYPASVLVAMYDIAFNCGSFKEWPRLTALIKSRNWFWAASESHRPAVSTSRNEDTFQQFTQGQQ